MDFAIARKGMVTMIVGEILGMVSSVLFSLCSFLLPFITYAFQNDKEVTISYLSVVIGLFAVVSNLLAVISGIIQIFALKKITKIDNKFKEALIILIFMLTCVFIRYFGDNTIDSIMSVLSDMTDLWIAVAVIQGCVNISDSMDDIDMSNRGLKVMKIVITLFAITIIGNIIFQYLVANPSFFLGSVISLAIFSILQVVIYIYYIGYLNSVVHYFDKKNA